MNALFLIYLVEVSLCMSIFYAFYKYLYFKLAYFEWSRIYFYAFTLISFAIPFIPGFLEPGKTSYINVGSNDVYIDFDKSSLLIYSIQENSLFEFLTGNVFINSLIFIWLLGFTYRLFFLISKIISVLRLTKVSEKILDGKYKIVKLDTSVPAFSFFNFIFINNNFENLNDDEKLKVMRHEKIHAIQKHSLDNIIFEFFRAVFWFNPINKAIAFSIKEIHEFIADNEVTGNRHQTDYSTLILKLACNNPAFPTVNNFSENKILGRIKILAEAESDKRRKMRFRVSLPVLAITTFALHFLFSSFNSVNNFIFLNDNEIVSPIEKGNYKIYIPFFAEKKLKKNNNTNYYFSHYEISCETESFSNIYSIYDGNITSIDTTLNMGQKEINITVNFTNNLKGEYKSLKDANVKESQIVKKGEVLGKTGDKRFYPYFNFKLTKDGIPVNPTIYFK